MLANNKLKNNSVAVTTDTGVTITLGSNAGVGAVINTQFGNRVAGYIDIITGTGLTAGNIFTLRFPDGKEYSNDNLIVKIIPLQRNSAECLAAPEAIGGNGFELDCNTVLQENNHYTWGYEITEVLQTTDVTTINTLPVNSKDSEPSTDDIPEGEFGVWDSPTTGETKLWVNIGGKLGCIDFNYAKSSYNSKTRS